jgi:hypothetical protein
LWCVRFACWNIKEEEVEEEVEEIVIFIMTPGRTSRVGCHAVRAIDQTRADATGHAHPRVAHDPWARECGSAAIQDRRSPDTCSFTWMGIPRRRRDRLLSCSSVCIQRGPCPTWMAKKSNVSWTGSRNLPRLFRNGVGPEPHSHPNYQKRVCSIQPNRSPPRTRAQPPQKKREQREITGQKKMT